MGGGYGRSLVVGATAALVVVVVIVAVALTVPGAQIVEMLGVSEPTRALVVLEAQAWEDVHLAQVVMEVDMSGPKAAVVVVDPTSRVEVPGTSYDTLRDAYPFGGGRAVAGAYARLTGDPQPPAVVLPAEQWGPLIDSVGGIDVSLESTVDVFLGDGLYSFVAGQNEVEGREVAPLLVGLEDAEEATEAAEVRSAVVRAFVESVAKDPGCLVRLRSEGRLSGDALGLRGGSLVSRLSDALGEASVSDLPARR